MRGKLGLRASHHRLLPTCFLVAAYYLRVTHIIGLYGSLDKSYDTLTMFRATNIFHPYFAYPFSSNHDHIQEAAPFPPPCSQRLYESTST